MLPKGAAKKVTIYVNEDTRHHLGPLYEAILTFLMHKGVAGATASRSLAGFGAHRVMHTTKVELLAEHLPVRIEFIETAEKVDELLPTLYDMVADGLIEVQDTTVIKAAGPQAEPQARQSHEIRRGKARLMRIFLGEADQWHGEPLVRGHRQAVAHDGHRRRHGLSRHPRLRRQRPHAQAAFSAPLA